MTRTEFVIDHVDYFSSALAPWIAGRKTLGKSVIRQRSSVAASLIIDYVLNVTVSIAAGVAALTSAFPGLAPYTLWIALAILAGITALNLRGIADSARTFMAPTIVFIAGIFTVIIVGLWRSEPASVLSQEQLMLQSQTIGVLLLLKAFSVGALC